MHRPYAARRRLRTSVLHLALIGRAWAHRGERIGEEILVRFDEQADQALVGASAPSLLAVTEVHARNRPMHRLLTERNWAPFADWPDVDPEYEYWATTY